MKIYEIITEDEKTEDSGLKNTKAPLIAKPGQSIARAGKAAPVDGATPGAIPGQTEVSTSLHDVALLPQLRNQDIYLQYRMGLAMAAAHAYDEGLIDWNEESAWGENMIIASYSDGEIDILNKAIKMMPGHEQVKRLTRKGSRERTDTNKVSPVAAPKKNKYGV
jgi:hypothetical protein